MKSSIKKFSVITLIAILVLAMGILSGCGNKDIPANSDEDATPVEGISKLDTVDVNGNHVDMNIFKDKKLTLVNVFSTNCGPCMGELPELADLSKELKDSDKGVVAVLLDTNANGKPDKSAGETAKGSLGSKAENLTIIYPDSNMQDTILSGVTSIPYSFFVNSEGKMVGQPYVGARSLDQWKSIMDDVYKNMKSEK